MDKSQTERHTNDSTKKAKAGAGRVTADKSTECDVKTDSQGNETAAQCGDLKDAKETKEGK